MKLVHWPLMGGL